MARVRDGCRISRHARQAEVIQIGRVVSECAKDSRSPVPSALDGLTVGLGHRCLGPRIMQQAAAPGRGGVASFAGAATRLPLAVALSRPRPVSRSGAPLRQAALVRTPIRSSSLWRSCPPARRAPPCVAASRSGAASGSAPSAASAPEHSSPEEGGSATAAAPSPWQRLLRTAGSAAALVVLASFSCVRAASATPLR